MDVQETTKAEILVLLREMGFPVPETMVFRVIDWKENPDRILSAIQMTWQNTLIAIRSSSYQEDDHTTSGAGVFESVLNVSSADFTALTEAITLVTEVLPHDRDQFFIQPMVGNVIISGVIMTRHLDDGAPYYVINYDDNTGRTDTITSGNGNHKTVFIYKGVQNSYFDSSRLQKTVELAKRLEAVYLNTPLDIEYAIDKTLNIHLLQVRKICAESRWQENVENEVHQRIKYLETFVGQTLGPRRGMFGCNGILGVMTDWNPAEMIGITPRPLALSLYRDLITKRVWSLAREEMGYQPLPPIELMLSVAGRPYIDVRASFNSFLPLGITPEISERLVNAWLQRLNDIPGFHDKVEFNVVHTIAEPGFDKSFHEWYPGVLSRDEFQKYKKALLCLTVTALAPESTLDKAMRDIGTLAALQERDLTGREKEATTASTFDLVLFIGRALEECRRLGTLPFAIVARHAFIAESFLRSIVREGAMEQERIDEFKQGIGTISKQFSQDFQTAGENEVNKRKFLQKYGHLRPGTYDILSPSYRERGDLFNTHSQERIVHDNPLFILTPGEIRQLDLLFKSSSLPTLDAQSFIKYAAKAIAGREYAKFIFTKHVSYILDLLVAWGHLGDMAREDVAMLSIDKIMEMLFKPLWMGWKNEFLERIHKARSEYEIMRSFKMAYIIRSIRDIYVVPQHRSAPNFITTKCVQAKVVKVSQGYEESISLDNCIVCIESADPGYDWIFIRNISGLITRYGGTNSHMAIRCAEYNLPAAIGCGDLLFEKVVGSDTCILDCEAKTITPLGRHEEINLL